MRTTRVIRNRSALPTVELGAFSPPDRGPLAFHRRLPGYAPTPLIAAPELAARLGVADVWVKDEASRLGLPSYKVLGASWAVYRTVIDELLAGDENAVEPWASFEELAARLAPLGAQTLVAATDGNHGRAVAYMARLLGWNARIYVPDDMVPARRDGIVAEGARVVEVVGGYDLAVETAAAQAAHGTVVIADTSYPGYETVPRRVTEGYSTIFWEIDQVIPSQPTVVAAQMGVGALAAAVVRRYRTGLEPQPPPLIVGVEPLGADCVLASVAAGQLTEVPGPHRSIMAGLNCGRASPVAWPLVSTGMDLFVAVGDDAAREAMRALAAAGVVSGESGAAGLAGLMALAAADGLSPQDRVLVLSTEGATDPAAYSEIVGRAA